MFLAILLISCGNTKTYTEQEQRAFQTVKDMVTARNFEIESNFARPMASVAFTQVANSGILGLGNTANSINISGTSNNLSVKGDTISGHFPYFGEQHFGGGYPGASHQGIEFKDIPENYEMTIDEKKHVITINFSIDDQYRNNERYNLFITIFQNKSSSIQINSTNRSSIEFVGSARSLKEDSSVMN